MCADCWFCDMNIPECTEWIVNSVTWSDCAETFRAVSRLLPSFSSLTSADYNLPYTFYLPSSFCMSWQFHSTGCNPIIVFDGQYSLLWRPLLCIFLSSPVIFHVLSTLIQTPPISHYSSVEVFRQLMDERSVKLDGRVVHQKLGNLVTGCTLTCALYGVLVLVCFWHSRCQLYCDFKTRQLQAKFGGLNPVRSRTSDGSLVRITSSCASCIGPVVWVRWWLCPTHTQPVKCRFPLRWVCTPYPSSLASWWPSE
jgi:hypothetical protein